MAIASINPATGETLREFSPLTGKEIEARLTAAEQAFQSYRGMSSAKRAAILFAAIGSSLVFLNVSAYWLRAVQGLLILATVLADMARRRRI